MKKEKRCDNHYDLCASQSSHMASSYTTPTSLILANRDGLLIQLQVDQRCCHSGESQPFK